MAGGAYPSDELLRKTELVTDGLTGGRAGALARLFAEIESLPPTIRWEPREDELEDGPLRFLLRLWHAKAVAGGLPPSRSIDAMELRPALGYVMLLEPIDGGADFRYRVYGSIIAEHAGLEMTGKRVWDIPAPLVAVYFLATYRAVLRTRRPMFAHHATHHDIQVAEWSRLILPFVDAAGTVDRLLVGNVPGMRETGPARELSMRGN